MTWRRWLGGGVTLLVALGMVWATAGGTACLSADTAWAQTPAPPPAPTPAPGSTDGDSGSNIFTYVFSMLFPIEDMTAALNQSISNILQGMVEDAAQPFVEALNNVFSSAIAGGPGEDAYGPPAATLRTISIMLWPLTLALIAVAAARGGAGSPAGFADLKEGLIEWVCAAVLTVASVYLIGLAVRLSGGITEMILGGEGSAIDATALVGVFFNIALVSVLIQLVPAAQIFFMLFMLILGFSVCAALVFAYVARYAMLIVLISVAPLVITLGVAPSLRWLLWMWLKGLTLMLLLGPVNALLIKTALAAALAELSAAGQANPFLGILNLLTTAAMLSLLLTVDYTVVKAVFGAIGEIVQKAKAATEQIVAGIVTLAGVALTGGLAGAGAAAAGAGATGAGGIAAGAGGGGGAGGGAAGAGAGAGAAGSEGGSAGASAAGANAASGTGASATKSAMDNPDFLHRMGAMLRTAGSAGMSSHSPITRAAAGVARGLGDAVGERASGIEQGEHEQERQEEQATRDQQRQTDLGAARAGAQERSLHRGWQGTLDANGISPSTPGFTDMSRSLSRLEDAYGGQAVRQAAPEVIQGMTAAQRYGGVSPDAQAHAAGYSSPADYLGGQVEGRIRAQGDGGQTAPIFGAGSAPSPGAWGPGPGPYDYRVGTDLAATLGRRGPDAVDAYARLAWAVRDPSLGAGQGAVDALYKHAGTAWDLGAGGGQSPDFAGAVWPYFARETASYAHSLGLADEQLPAAWIQEQMFLAKSKGA